MPEEIESTPVEDTPEVTPIKITPVIVNAPKTSKVEETTNSKTADEEFQKWWRREQM